MTYPLPADLQIRIQAQLASGDFTTEEEVLREAIEALERRQRGLAKLRQLVSSAHEDVVAGRIGTYDRESIKRDVRAQLSEQGIN